MATRRQFTSEFKLEIVKMVIDQGGSIGKLSKDQSINDCNGLMKSDSEIEI